MGYATAVLVLVAATALAAPTIDYTPEGGWDSVKYPEGTGANLHEYPAGTGENLPYYPPAPGQR